MLVILLIVQACLLLFSLGFLLAVRAIIQPFGVWLSFVVRDVLWLLLTVDQFVHLNQMDFLSFEITIVLQFAIVCLLLYATIGRYQANKIKLLLTPEQIQKMVGIEADRLKDETGAAIPWDLQRPR
jgi:hypothetical protein